MVLIVKYDVAQQIFKYLSASIEQGKNYINNAVLPEQKNQDSVVDAAADTDAVVPEITPESVV